MLPGKGKHGFKKTGKGGKDVSKMVAGSSKVTKDQTPTKVKMSLGGDLPEGDGVVTSLPLFRTMDNSRLLPRYTAVLTRTEDEGVGMEDLDTLQLELEALLSCVAVRNRVLREEIKLLETVEEKRDKKSKLAVVKRERTAPAQRHEERPVKKLKETIKTEAQTGRLNKLRRLPGATSTLTLEMQSRDSPKPDAPKIVMHKNDTPNKFWASVEPYCANITQEDLTYLEDMIRAREEDRDSELMKIPPLGRHYSLRWTEEDLAEDARAGLEQTAGQDRLGGASGPLTQRLLSALIDEKGLSLPETNENKPGLGQRDTTLTSGRGSVLKNVQSLALERRLRRELRDQGILDADEAPKDQADDELLLEMKRVQAELQAISAHNLQQLKHLHSLAVNQMVRQDLKRKLKAVDTELLNIYASKQKKKHLTKKEKDQAWRFIKEREGLLKQLYVSSDKG